MERADLERLDRNTLISKAEGLGVTRANILTRPELVDELLVRSARAGDKDLPRARGFFGRARDLVARVIEKGLHLPDAAERLRSVTATASELASRVIPAVVPTVTLAEIYAAQGHRPRAVETLKRVLELEPDHGAAHALLTKLQVSESVPPPAIPPEPEPEEEQVATLPRERVVETRPERAVQPAANPDDHAESPRSAEASRPSIGQPEPAGFLDDSPPPPRYDVDECVSIAVDPRTLYIYWEVRDATLAQLRASRPGGGLTLRLLVITPSWDGPRSAVRDFDVDASQTDRFVRDLPQGSVVRAAIGWRTGEAFLPIAHAPALETPPGERCPIAAEAFVRWTPRGLAPVTPLDTDYASIGRALGHFAPRREDVMTYDRVRAPMGSSDVSAGFGSEGARFENAPSSRLTS